jgi:hypothetical protein
MSGTNGWVGFSALPAASASCAAKEQLQHRRGYLRPWDSFSSLHLGHCLGKHLPYSSNRLRRGRGFDRLHVSMVCQPVMLRQCGERPATTFPCLRGHVLIADSFMGLLIFCDWIPTTFSVGNAESFPSGSCRAQSRKLIICQSEKRVATDWRLCCRARRMPILPKEAKNIVWPCSCKFGPLRVLGISSLGECIRDAHYNQAAPARHQQQAMDG